MEKIMISEMPKADMLLILEALDYTAMNTKIEAYSKLKDNIIEELMKISGVPLDGIIDFLES